MNLRANNVVPGVTFIQLDQTFQTPSVWVAMEVKRNVELESVVILARRADTADEDWPNAQVRSFARSFNHELPVIGVCVNPLDVTDTDWGTDL